MMRKMFLIILILILNIRIYSQDEINFGDFPKPVASVSSLSEYVNNPVSLATGIPDISIPLFNLPTNKSQNPINISINYHAGNVNESEAGSEIGLGWSLFAGGIISREIIGELDEKYSNSSAGNYIKNEFDDFYYYNFSGGSGKFKISRDIINNTFSIIKLTPDDVKIEFVKDTNNSTLIVNSFIITDGKGNKYYFNDYSIAVTETYLELPIQYKSAFFLTKILDSNNIEYINYTYQKDTKNKPNSNQLLYKNCKLKTINSINYGTIVINYNYDSTLENTMNDPYNIANIILQNKFGVIINQFSFEYDFYNFQYDTTTYVNKRILKKLKKLNKSLQEIEKTTFEYSNSSENNYGPNPSDPYTFGNYLCEIANSFNNPKYFSSGVLNRIINPTGGVVEYSYEANQYYSDKSQFNDFGVFSDPEIQYLEQKQDIFFDTAQSKSYPILINGISNQNKELYIYFQITDYYGGSGNNELLDPLAPDIIPDPITNNPNLTITYKLFKNGIEQYSSSCSTGSHIKKFLITPGNYTLQIFGTGGKGILQTHEVVTIDPPFKNAVSTGNYGVRIKNIKSYESSFSSLPQNIISYNYDEFLNPLNSSGQIISNEDNGMSGNYMPYILYKNVKVTDSNNGHTKYYFKTPKDFPISTEVNNNVYTNYWPYYSLVKRYSGKKRNL